MSKTFSSFWAVVVVAGFAGNAEGQEHGWPVGPINDEHPLAATLGEFQSWGDTVYQHTGLDILSSPCHNPCSPGDAACDNPCKCGQAAATTNRCVVTTVSGTVDYLPKADSAVSTSGDPLYIRSTHMDAPEIIAENKRRIYRYLHLERGSYLAEFVNKYKKGQAVPSGTSVAQVIPWTCENNEYSHLHYDVFETNLGGGDSTYLNPLSGIGSNPDQQAPEFVHYAGRSAINFANHELSRWSPFPQVDGACTVVSGTVDIVVGLLDRDDAGSTLPGVSNIGVYNLRWRVCPDSQPDCRAWNETHIFEDMPTAWGDDRPSAATQQQFSTAEPWRSDFDMCSTSVNKTFMVATSRAPWATTAANFPDGSYTVAVEASDRAGNATTETAHTCVQNEADCTLDLAIRHGTDDTGAVPYTGLDFEYSPYITVNAGTADENQKIRLGQVNSIRVEVWNSGSCPLLEGTEYEVCVGWNKLSNSVLFPTNPNQRISCKTESMGTGESWEPGTGRTTTFTWTPGPGDAPAGFRALVAWADAEGDRVDSARPVALDNNQAQRNIVFTPAP
jgi:hypothetical protein